MGILESLGKSFYVPVYAIVYERTLATWAGAFYIFSFFILTLAAVLFLYVLLLLNLPLTNDSFLTNDF